MGEEKNDTGGRKGFSEGIDIIIDEAKVAASQAYKSSESIGEGIKKTLREALAGRDNVVMVRLNRESVAKLDDLIEAGLVNSRSEAAAFLIGEGASSRSQLFERIAEKTEMIRRAKEELRNLIEKEPTEKAPG